VPFNLAEMAVEVGADLGPFDRALATVRARLAAASAQFSGILRRGLDFGGAVAARAQGAFSPLVVAARAAVAQVAGLWAGASLGGGLSFAPLVAAATLAGSRVATAFTRARARIGADLGGVIGRGTGGAAAGAGTPHVITVRVVPQFDRAAFDRATAPIRARVITARIVPQLEQEGFSRAMASTRSRLAGAAGVFGDILRKGIGIGGGIFGAVTKGLAALPPVLAGSARLITGVLGGAFSVVSLGAGLAFTAIGKALSAAIAAAGAALNALKGVAVVAGIGIAGGLAFATNEASNLNETVQKTEVVFGDMASYVKTAADHMAADFGTSRRTFLDAAASFGLIAKGAGFASDAAADTSVHLARLAIDAASFYNVGLDEALEKIRSGLVGEAEPLRAFGVLLSETAVKAEAVRLGLAGAKKELTESQKVQARVSLITKGLSSASGDLVRTQSAVANRTREIRGRLQNLAADLGQYLLPAVQRLTADFSDALTGIERYLEGNKAALQAWGDRLADVAGNAATAWKHWPEALEVVKEFAREKVTNILDVFRWLVSNIPAVMDRVAVALGEGMYAALQGALEIATRGALKIGEVLALAASNPTQVAGYVAAGAADIGALLPRATPRDFTKLQLTESAGLQDALFQFGNRRAEDEQAKAAAEARARSDAELATAGQKFRELAALPAEARKKLDDATRVGGLAGRYAGEAVPGRDTSGRLSDEQYRLKMIEKDALRRQMANAPPEATAPADAAAEKKKKKDEIHYGVTDIDSFQREVQDRILNGKDDIAAKQLTEAERANEKLEDIRRLAEANERNWNRIRNATYK
jgi:hypothetical protein